MVSASPDTRSTSDRSRRLSAPGTVCGEPARRRGVPRAEDHGRDVTVLLIAHDGEWTRRRVPSFEAARAWGNRIGIPVYDARPVGYPKRMREYGNERRKQAEQS